MLINNATAREAVMSYMGARCDVSSQHKLPTEAELLGTHFARFIGEGRIRVAVGQLVRAGELRRYGPYLSDRVIEVL